jgi:hypothetical protein
MASVALKRSPVEILTADKSAELFDRYVRSALGITGVEFVKRHKNRQYEKSCCDSKVLKAIMLMPGSSVRRGKK